MAIDDVLGGRFGDAGARVVIEEFLEGEIASLFALCDGESSVLFGGAQDHKRAFDGDKGPNTGGMGAYAPAPIPLALHGRGGPADPDRTGFEGPSRRKARPIAAPCSAKSWSPTRAPKLIEFNVRFGDPECQVLMLRLESDIVPYLLACARGGLADLPPPHWRDEAVVCVVLAARGYPEAPATGGVITGAEADFGDDVVVFHAGVEAGSGRGAGFQRRAGAQCLRPARPR